MKPFRSNTGLVAVVVNSSQFDGQGTTLWCTQISTWLDRSQQECSRTNSLTLYADHEKYITDGVVMIAKVAYRTMQCKGNDGSDYTQSYYELVEILSLTQSQDLPSLCQFTLGGNVGSVEQVNHNGKTWFNVTLALHSSYRDSNNEWQKGQTHWARLSISKKVIKSAFSQGLALTKGDSILVEVSLSTSSFQDKHLNTVTSHEFHVNRVLGFIRKSEFEAVKFAFRSKSNS